MDSEHLVQFIPSEQLVQGGFQDFSCEGGHDEGPALISFEPWVSLQDDEGHGREDWAVTAADGLIGRAGGFDPTMGDPQATADDWVMSFELDPPHESDLWPMRWRGEDATLSDEQRALLVGNPLPGGYLVKLGIFGPWVWRCFFGEKIEEHDFVQDQEGYDPAEWLPTGPIPVLVKVVTGRGDLFKVQEFRYNLAVPNMQGRSDIYATFPDYYASPISPTDTGVIPTGSDSQYEAASFLIDPYGGARRVDDIDPWGIG